MEKVINFKIENLGGNFLGIFGKLADGTYFAGDENDIYIFDINVYDLYMEENQDRIYWDNIYENHLKNHYDNSSFEYYNIMKQTNYYNDEELENLKNYIIITEEV